MGGTTIHQSFICIFLKKKKKVMQGCYAVATACAGRVVANTRSQQQEDGDCLHSVSNTQNSCSQVAALSKRSVYNILEVQQKGLYHTIIS